MSPVFIYVYAGLQTSLKLHVEGKNIFLNTISVLINVEFYIHITPQLYCP